MTSFMVREDSEDENVFADENHSETMTYSGKMIRLCNISKHTRSLRSFSEFAPFIELNIEEKIEEKPTFQIKRKGFREKKNPFDKYNVPVLVIQCIFSKLRKRDLYSAMQVCKKFYDVGNLSKSWLVTDVSERPVSEFTLYGLSQRKVQILRLSAAKITPDLEVSMRMLEDVIYSKSRLEVLDLSGSFLTHRQLMMVLRPCEKLKFLSLEGNLLDDDIASCVGANHNLRQLDISMTQGITLEGAHFIFSSCQKLEELNASWCGLDKEILHVIVENLSSKIRKLNLAGSNRSSGLNDEHVQMLLSACPKLTDIDLSDSMDIGDRSIRLILLKPCHLKTLSINRCFGIDPNVIILLNDAKSLCHLNLHGCVADENMELFNAMCNRLIVNKQYFNYTAKPITNPTTSSSIYGYRVVEDL